MLLMTHALTSLSAMMT